MRFAMGAAAAILLAMATGGAAAEDGLGVTRDEMMNFARSLGITLERTPDTEGFPTWEGANSAAAIQTIGPPEDLLQVYVAFGMHPDEDENMRRFGAGVQLLVRTVPGWAPFDALAWLGECLPAEGGETMRQGRGIRCDVSIADKSYSLTIWR